MEEIVGVLVITMTIVFFTGIVGVSHIVTSVRDHLLGDSVTSNQHLCLIGTMIEGKLKTPHTMKTTFAATISTATMRRTT